MAREGTTGVSKELDRGGAGSEGAHRVIRDGLTIDDGVFDPEEMNAPQAPEDRLGPPARSQPSGQRALDGRLTAGRFVAPPDNGPSIHSHRYEEELPIVIEGRSSFFTDGRWSVGRRDLMNAPRRGWRRLDQAALLRRWSPPVKPDK